MQATITRTERPVHGEVKEAKYQAIGNDGQFIFQATCCAGSFTEQIARNMVVDYAQKHGWTVRG